MILHRDISAEHLRSGIRKNRITIAGNGKLKIYGKLNCRTGMRMKKTNRVFFASGDEAVAHGYRPCAHCMYNSYQRWKKGLTTF